MSRKIIVLVMVLSLSALACNAASALLGNTGEDGGAAGSINATDEASVDPGADPTGGSGGADEPETGGVVAGAGDLSGACANSYYPIVEGRTLHYTITSPENTVNLSITFSDVTPDGFLVTQHLDDILSSEIYWECNSEGLISSQYANINMASLGFELTTIDHAGAIIPLESEMVPGGSWTNNFDVSGLFSSEIGTGSVQMNVVENATATGYESVSTPYMEFKTALRVESEGTIDMNTVFGEISTGLVTIEVNSTNWFVQGVGLVRQEGESEGLSSVMVLVAIDN